MSASQRVSAPLSFRVMDPVPLREDFNTAPFQLIYTVGHTITLPSMVIRMALNEKASAYAGIEAYGSGRALSINRYPGNPAVGGTRMRVRLELKFEYRRVQFTWSYAHAVGTARFYRADNSLLEEVNARVNTGSQSITSRTFGTNSIKFIDIDVIDAIALDDFIFTR